MRASNAVMYETVWTPVRIFVLAFGLVYTLVGILGFVGTAVTGQTGFVDGTGELLDIFAINPAHNVVHLAAGVLAILAAARNDLSRFFAQIFGVVFLLLAIWGFALVGATGTEIEEILGFLPVNAADNWLHLATAAALLFFGLVPWAWRTPVFGGEARPVQR